MKSELYTNESDIKFIDKLKRNLDLCRSFCFSVSFIKRPGLRLLAPNIEAAIARGASGLLITSTYQNFTDVDSLQFFLRLQQQYPERFACHLDRECFHDSFGNTVGFHSKGYLFEFEDHQELLVGSSNITVYALLKNVEWDVSVVEEGEGLTYAAAKMEFDALWQRTLPLDQDLIDEYNGLAEYGVGIHLDDLSKKDILEFINQENFNRKIYLKQDYDNFKNFISASSYPQHVDYLNNDYAPDLIKFMQAKIGSRKNASYYGFLKAIEEKGLPSFDERQESFIRYVSEMLPIVRPYEYLIIRDMLDHAWNDKLEKIRDHVMASVVGYRQEAFDHAVKYMLKSRLFSIEEECLVLNNLRTGVEFDEYMRDLLDYGLGKYDIDSYDAKPDELFHLWKSYRKSQVQQLLLNNPHDIIQGTKIDDGIVYIYVTIVKDASIKDTLKYEDGYIDPNTFRWETVANVSEKELSNLKNTRMAQVFVRKMEDEDGITLPFTYIGSGKMEYIEGSRRMENGAHRFRIAMNSTAPEDIYFDFKLPE